MIKNKLTGTFKVVTISLCLGASMLISPLALAGGGGSGSSGGSSTSGGCSGTSCTQGGTHSTTASRSTANEIARNLNSNPSSMGTNMEAVVTTNRNGTVSVSVRSTDRGGNDSSSGSPTPTSPNGSIIPGSFTRAATGYFDVADSSNCTVQGWAYDPDNAGAAISVHVYQDGRAGVGRFVTSCQANQSRPDVNAIIRIPGNHGFNCPLPASFRNTGSHRIFIHAIDINGTPNNLLRTNGKSISCGTSTTTTPGSPTGCPASAPWDSARGICYDPSTATPGTITVTAQSTVVRKLTLTNISWQISNPIPPGYTCTLTGPGINIPITTQTGSRPSRPIDSTSVFTVSCDNGSTTVSGEATVEIIPQVQEV
ncbi:MAG: hypothetical protein V4668_04620 [Patescibacteria group bacterium]